MSRCRLLVLIAVISGSLLICGWFVWTPMRLWQAEQHSDVAVALLPEPESFTIVATTTRQYGDRVARQTCYFADTLTAIGTNLPTGVALDQYAAALQAQGWAVREIGVWSVALVRGENERVTVYGVSGPQTGAFSANFRLDAKYQQEKDHYATFVYLYHSYSLPDRITCLGE